MVVALVVLAVPVVVVAASVAVLVAEASEVASVVPVVDGSDLMYHS